MSETLRLEYDAATHTLYIRLPEAAETWPGWRPPPRPQVVLYGRKDDTTAQAGIRNLWEPGFVPVPPDDDSGAVAYLPVYRYEEESHGTGNA